MNKQPTIGSIVHLHQATRTLAAIITAVHEDGVSLTVFQPDSLPGYIEGHIAYADDPTPGYWSWIT